MHIQDQQSYDARPASSRQMAFIKSLMSQRQVSSVQTEWLAKHESELDTRTASRIITTLLAAPEQTRVVTHAVGSVLPDVPEGRYALEEQGVLKFYVIDKPTAGKWAGRTFVKVQASDNLFPVRNPDARRLILASIAVDPKAASLRYGRELGVCGVCGRTLTDEESRAAGIGPICVEKRGWQAAA